MTPERLDAQGVAALCDFIERGTRAGLALHPIVPNGSKGAIGKWGKISTGEQPPQSARDLVMLVRSGRCDGIAVLTGRASGNIEMLEVEGRCVERLEEVARIAGDTGLGELLQRMTQGWSELTPSSGVHFYYRISDGPVAGNTILAQRPGADGKPEVLAETRGRGGYSICAPSGGRTHETGFAYEFLCGSPETVPTFTASEVEELHRLFRILDEMPVPEPRPITTASAPRVAGDHPRGLSPGDDFNERATWDEVLEDWTRVGEGTDRERRRVSYWRRPGKAQGISATVLGEGARLYVFSTSTALPTEEALSKFAVYAHLHRDGDFSAAASDLRRQGYGDDGGAAEPARPPVEYQPFPVDSLPQPLRQFVREGAQATGCDPAYIALPALSAIAAAIGNTRQLRVKPNWTVRPILWTMTVGESGNQKSTGFDLALRPLQRVQQEALGRYEEQRRRYEVVLEAYEANRGRRPRGEDGDGAPRKPKPPTPVRHIVGDTTVEALAPLLNENPRGLLLARDELRGWIGSFDRYASGSKAKSDEANWLSMYNGGSMLVDRKNAQTGPIHVPRASVCITGGIQPGTLQRALGSEHRESGLVARILMAYPPRRAKQWSEARISPDVERAYDRLFEQLLRLEMALPAVDEPSSRRGPVDIQLSDEAKDRFVAYYNEHNREAADLSGELASAWSKLEETAARIALVIELVQWAESGCNSPPESVSVQSMEMAITLVEWFKQETRRIYAGMFTAGAGAKPLSARDQLVEWLARRGGEVTVRELQQGCRAYKAPGTAEAALQDLVTSGRGEWLTAEAGSHRGRQRFRLVG